MRILGAYILCTIGWALAASAGLFIVATVAAWCAGFLVGMAVITLGMRRPAHASWRTLAKEFWRNA